VTRASGNRASTSSGPVKSSWVTRGYSAKTISKRGLTWISWLTEAMLRA
jgi:hypothetical protein